MKMSYTNIRQSKWVLMFENYVKFSICSTISTKQELQLVLHYISINAYMGFKKSCHCSIVKMIEEHMNEIKDIMYVCLNVCAI